VWVECVPNFSEGRDPVVIARLATAAASVPGASLLDQHSDPDHHRTVFTLAGSPAAVSEAVFRAVRVAVETIDLTQHEGVHPRIGAADVVPFVPLGDAPMETCVELAQALGRRLADELELPVYLYREAASSPQRASLPWLRRPGFEGLAAALQEPDRAPDFGPAAPHPTAGATAVGARELLLAFNVDLESDDLKLAKRIAKAVRTSSGGLPGVHAKGMGLSSQGRVQVSMNLFELGRTGPGRVHGEIARLAGEAGVAVARSEVVGLMPRAALREAAATGLQLDDTSLRVLEDDLEWSLDDPGGALRHTLSRIGAPGPFDPGGGTAAALSLALGRAALGKALALSRGDKGQLDDAELDALETSLPGTGELLSLAGDDHRAFADLMSAWRQPKGEARKQALRQARGPAVAVPERLLELAVTIAEAAAVAAERGNPNLVNDAVAASELAQAAARICRVNARSNQTKATRRDYDEALARLDAALARARAAGR
jgi:glutamate formiminotransferase/formiminotetrahydrofolate cyclodeaminase